MNPATTERTKTTGRALSAAFLLSLAILSAGPLLAPAPRAAQSFNNVQLFVTTSSQLSYSFTFSAYNLSGSLVGSYQSQYPAAGFELPNGDYLFTVSAIHQAIYPPCMVCAYSSTGVANGASPPAKNATGQIDMPVYYQPASEYGFLTAHVDSAQTFNIATKNVTDYSTTQVQIKVQFVNGTAASGASVSASVVGQWAYWWGQGAKVSMWAQTGPDGTATLVLPDAPVVVTAWDWVPIHLPPGQTTVVEDVGGQKVNVTVYWQPSYVGLSGSTLLLPPFSSTSITLKYQQPSYWAIPAGTNYAPGSAGGASPQDATVANQPNGVPGNVQQTPTQGSQSSGQYYLPSQIPSIKAGSQASSGNALSAPMSLFWLAGPVIAAFLIASAAAVLVMRKNRNPPTTTLS